MARGHGTRSGVTPEVKDSLRNEQCKDCIARFCVVPDGTDWSLDDASKWLPVSDCYLGRNGPDDEDSVTASTGSHSGSVDHDSTEPVTLTDQDLTTTVTPVEDVE